MFKWSKQATRQWPAGQHDGRSGKPMAGWPTCSSLQAPSLTCMHEEMCATHPQVYATFAQVALDMDDISWIQPASC